MAHWLVAGGARVELVAGGGSSTARELATLLAADCVPAAMIESKSQDLLLIAVPDPALPQVAQQLADRRQAPVVLHTSGRYTSDVLQPLRDHSCAIGSLHPLKAFPTQLAELAEAEGTVFAVDGDSAARSLASRLAAAWRGIAVEIPAELRSLYHFLATVAAGGVVTLLAATCELSIRVGLPRAVADGYLELARGALKHVESGQSVPRFITGPVARGDLVGFREQLAGLAEADPSLADIVERLADQTLRLRGNPS